MKSRPPWRRTRSVLSIESARVLWVARGGCSGLMSLKLPQRLVHGVAHQGLLVLNRLLQRFPGFGATDLAEGHGRTRAGFGILFPLEESALCVQHRRELGDALRAAQ